MSKRTLLAALASLSALSLAACGASSATPAAPTTEAPHTDHTHHDDDHGHDDHGHGEDGHDHDEHGHDHGEDGHAPEETPDQSPRIVVGTETGVTVLDADLSQVGTFTTTARPTLTTAHDDRHVVAVQGEAGVVNILDAGSWTTPHGNHYHHFLAEPTLLDEALEGGKPVHVVANAAANSTAVYFDEEGTAHSLTTEALLEKELHGLRTVSSNNPHHGVVVPLADGTWLVTQKGDDALPDSIDWVTDDGEVKGSVECADLHGETVVKNTVAYGCSDSVIMVQDGKATVVANPDDSGERVGALVSDAHGKVFVGDWASDSLVFIADGKASIVEVGAEYSNLVAVPDGTFAVLGTDGTLRVYDAHGHETATYEVTAPWTKGKGHGALAPSLAAGQNAGANTIWVSEPGAGKVHAVDLFAKKVTSTDVAGQPGSLAVTNATA